VIRGFFYVRIDARASCATPRHPPAAMTRATICAGINQGITIIFLLLGYALGAAILGFALYWIIRVAVTHGIRAAREHPSSGDD